MMLLQLLIAIPVWLGFITLWIPLCILGHIVIPILLLTQSYGPSHSWRYNHETVAFKPESLFYIWSNEGDSILGPPEYQQRYPEWSVFRRAWTWSAVRNPVNNLRFVKYLRLDIEPEKIKWAGSFGSDKKDVMKYDEKVPFWLLCWQGAKTNILFQYKSPINGRMVKFHLGWKVYPKDINGFTIPYRKYGAGFALMSWKYIN